MKHPTTAWWCGYWKEAYPEQTDVVDRGVDCPTHERNDGGPAEDRGCRPVAVVPLPPEGTKRLVAVGDGEWDLYQVGNIIGGILAAQIPGRTDKARIALSILDALDEGEDSP